MEPVSLPPEKINVSALGRRHTPYGPCRAAGTIKLGQLRVDRLAPFVVVTSHQPSGCCRTKYAVMTQATTTAAGQRSTGQARSTG